METWVFNEGRIVWRKITFSPSLFKIFDEILVNAADHYENKKNMTTLKVDINTAHGEISVWNDGDPIPIVRHKDAQVYLPEFIFGFLRAGSNFNDDEQRTTGGRNGLGAKLCNIFSKKFKVEIYDASSKLYYVQEWSNGMKHKTAPKISTIVPPSKSRGSSSSNSNSKSCEFNTNFTRISFIPDLKEFSTATLDADLVSLFSKRVLDVAGTSSKLKVFLNSKEVSCDSFEDYVNLYEPIQRQPQKNHCFVQHVNASWQIGICLSEGWSSTPTSASASASASASSSVKGNKKPQTTTKTNKKDGDGKEDKTAQHDDNNNNNKNKAKHSKAKEKSGEMSVAVVPAAAAVVGERKFKQISFVNSCCTFKGGKHVDYVLQQLLPELLKYLNKKIKGAETSLTNVWLKKQLHIFVNARIVNPAFDTQTKHTLTTKPEKFLVPCNLSESKFVSKLISKRPHFIEELLLRAQSKSTQTLQKSDGTKHLRGKPIDKLEDAKKAGTALSNKCILILTEGDSAKALAMAGIHEIGRNFYGVFPLKGKVINVHDVSLTKLEKNAEFTKIKKIIGLKQGVDYSIQKNFDELRYGGVMFMTDQDPDGSHIKGLLLNMFATFWPALLKRPRYLSFFQTPLIKSKRRNEVKVWYDKPSELAWRASLTEKENREWVNKYYKGLGTSTKAEGKEYFRFLKEHKINFTCSEASDQEKLKMVFDKHQSKHRKQWLQDLKETKSEATVVSSSSSFSSSSSSSSSSSALKTEEKREAKKEKEISITKFVDEELAAFSHYNCARVIPNVVDGLKPGQRKILYCAMIKRNLENDTKLTTLSGNVMEHAAYHHGEDSLIDTMVRMAQDYIGSNNLNLLVPSGQFGSRDEMGKDSASARYIHTRLHPLTRLLFHPHDDPILQYLEEDGMTVEPHVFLPILPLVLVNGANGIGTGWSTTIPSFNPLDLVHNLKCLLNESVSVKTRYEQCKELKPWIRGWKGEVLCNHDDGLINQTNFVLKGLLSHNAVSGLIKITEIPPDVSKTEFKLLLAKLLEAKQISKFEDDSHDEDIIFHIKCSSEQIKKLLAEFGTLTCAFKLETKISLSNMTLYTSENKIQTYESPADILFEFFHVRKPFYELRKANLLQEYNQQLLVLRNRARFITMILNKTLIIDNIKKKDVETKLATLKFDLKKNSYDYLLDMKMVSLTKEKVDLIQRELKVQEQQLKELENTSLSTLWIRDLEAFEKEWIKDMKSRNFSIENHRCIVNNGCVSLRDLTKPRQKRKLESVKANSLSDAPHFPPPPDGELHPTRKRRIC